MRLVGSNSLFGQLIRRRFVRVVDVLSHCRLLDPSLARGAQDMKNSKVKRQSMKLYYHVLQYYTILMPKLVFIIITSYYPFSNKNMYYKSNRSTNHLICSSSYSSRLVHNSIIFFADTAACTKCDVSTTATLRLLPYRCHACHTAAIVLNHHNQQQGMMTADEFESKSNCQQ